jgi:hypothetical protein
LARFNESNMTDRIERLERHVRRLTVAVVILSAVVLYLCLPVSFREYVLAAIPVMGFLIVAGLLTLVMIHRQIPAIAREVGRWFAPLR